MNENQNVGSYLSIQQNSHFQAILPSLIVSFVLHVIFFSVLFYSPGSFFKKKINPAAINVNLVSLPQYFPEPQLPKAKGSLKQKTKKAEKQSVEKVKDKPVVTKPKSVESPEEPVKEKISLKKKTFKTGEVVKKPEKEAPKKQEEAAKEQTKEAPQEEKTEPQKDEMESVAKALERLKENLGDAEPEGSEEGSEDTPYAGTSPGGGSGSVALEAMEIYLLQVKEIFNRNWAFSDQLAGRFENLETIVVCTIMPNGNIGDVWFEKRSGNTHLDDSAYKAVLKSGPLPPLPPGVTQAYTAGYVFTPSGVQ
jgi:colicin import membrane protein